MTGYTVHTGSTVKFSGGWDHIFSGKKPAKSAAAKASGKKKGPAKKSPAKSAKKGSASAAKKTRGRKAG